MEELRYRIRYEGGDADFHRLPAHELAQSLEGVSWAFSLIGNYIATGEIRKRGSLDRRVRFYLTPIARGSVAADIVAFISEPQNQYITSIIGAYAVATFTDSFNYLLLRTLRGVAGIFDPETRRENRLLSGLPSGDAEALMDAVEPAMTRAHDVIDDGAEKLKLIRGRTELVEYNKETKQYIKASITAEHEVEGVLSVGAFNANSGNGRVYFPDIGKVVPFSMVREPDPGTSEALATSLARYARGQDSRIIVRYRSVFTVDDRIKKIIISGARYM